MTEPVRIAIVGAESTGKSTLAVDLAEALAQQTGLAAIAVPEALRAWCDREGRTPRRDEQAAIAHAQQAAIDAAAASHQLVVCDTTALMTAVYSHVVFDDQGLDEQALRWQARFDATLLTALDLPWVPDGLQRDGPHVREPVDDRLRALLGRAGLPWSLVAGSGPARLQSALDAVAPQLRRLSTPRRGLFTRLADRDAAAPDWPWLCDCDDPGCEHATRIKRQRRS
mgnify:FL=1